MFTLIKIIITLIVSIVVGIYFGGYFDDESIKAIVGGLTNVSAAVFAISGLWISQVYPEALKAFTKNIDIIAGSDRAKRIEDLVFTIAKSAFVLVSILLLHFCLPVVKNILVDLSLKIDINNCVVGILTFLTLIQMSSVTSIMFHTFRFADLLHSKNEEAKVNKRLDNE